MPPKNVINPKIKNKTLNQRKRLIANKHSTNPTMTQIDTNGKHESA